MTKEELNAVGIYADTATFIHGHGYNMLHDGDRASLYRLDDGGKSFKLMVEITGARQMRQIAMAFNHAADLTDAATEQK